MGLWGPNVNVCRSTELDEWKPQELAAMKCGGECACHTRYSSLRTNTIPVMAGNEKAKKFFRLHGWHDFAKAQARGHCCRGWRRGVGMDVDMCVCVCVRVLVCACVCLRVYVCACACRKR